MRKKLILLTSTILFILSLYLFYLFDVSLNDIVTLPLKLIKSSTNGFSLYGSNVFPVILFLIFQITGFILIGVYSLKDVSKHRLRLSVLSGFVAIVAGLFFLTANFIYLAFSVGFLVSCYVVSNYFPRFYEEYKVWRYFRTGSEVVRIALLILSFFVAFGMYLQISYDHHLQQQFYNSTIDALRSGISTDSNASSIPGYNDLSPEQKATLDKRYQQQNEEAQKQIDQLVKQQIDTSPVISAYIHNLGIITAIAIFSAFLFLRSIIAPLAGVISFSILTILQRKKKHHHQVT